MYQVKICQTSDDGDAFVIKVGMDKVWEAGAPPNQTETEALRQFLRRDGAYNSPAFELVRSKKGKLLLRAANDPGRTVVNLSVPETNAPKRRWVMDEEWVRKLADAFSHDRFPKTEWKEDVTEIRASINNTQDLCMIHFSFSNRVPGVSLRDLRISSRGKTCDPLRAISNAVQTAQTAPAVLNDDAVRAAKALADTHVRELMKQYGISKDTKPSTTHVGRLMDKRTADSIEKLIDAGTIGLAVTGTSVPSGAFFSTTADCEIRYYPWSGRVVMDVLEQRLAMWHDLQAWNDAVEKIDAATGSAAVNIKYKGVGRGLSIEVKGPYCKYKYTLEKPHSASELAVLLRTIRKEGREQDLFLAAQKKLQEAVSKCDGIRILCSAEDGKLVYKLDTMYDLEESGLIDYHTAYISTFRARLKLFSIKVEKAKAEEEKKFRADPLYGFLPGVVLAKLVCANEKFITVNQAVGLLRGTSVTFAETLNKTGDEGKYNLIPAVRMEQVIDELVKVRILSKRYREGTYSSYYVLKTTELTKRYIASGSVSKEKDPLKMTDCELLAWLRNGKRKLNQKSIPELIDRLIERPQLYCADSMAYLLWFTDLPERFQEYTKALYAAETDAYKRKLMKQILAAVEAGSVAESTPHISAAKPKKEEMWKIVESETLSSRYDKRYVIANSRSGNILDDAQGYGYKSAANARAAWLYKNRDKTKDREKAEKKAEIRKWMKVHRDFMRLLEQCAFEIAKGSWGPKDKVDAKFVKQMLLDAGLETDFTPGQLLKAWQKR